MAATMKDLGLDRLTAAERLSLAEELWESVGPADDIAVPWVEPLTPEVRAMLNEQRAFADAHPEQLIPAADVMADYFRGLPR